MMADEKAGGTMLDPGTGLPDYSKCPSYQEYCNLSGNTSPLHEALGSVRAVEHHSLNAINQLGRVEDKDVPALVHDLNSLHDLAASLIHRIAHTRDENEARQDKLLVSISREYAEAGVPV